MEISELIIGVVLTHKQRCQLCFSYPSESRNAAFSNQFHIFSLLFTFPTSEKGWLVTLGMATFIFAHVSAMS